MAGIEMMMQSGGNDLCGVSSSLSSKVFDRHQTFGTEAAIRAQSYDLATIKSEHIDQNPIDFYRLRVERSAFRDKETGEYKEDMTLVSPDFNNEAIQTWTDDGTHGYGSALEWKRIDERARLLAETEGDASLFWVSRGNEKKDDGKAPHRAYLWIKRGREVEAFSYQLFGSEETLGNLVDKLTHVHEVGNGKSQRIEDKVVMSVNGEINHSAVYDAFQSSLSAAEKSEHKGFLKRFQEEAAMPDSIRIERLEKEAEKIEARLKEIYKEDISQAFQAIVQGMLGASEESGKKITSQTTQVVVESMPGISEKPGKTAASQLTQPVEKSMPGISEKPGEKTAFQTTQTVEEGMPVTSEKPGENTSYPNYENKRRFQLNNQEGYRLIEAKETIRWEDGLPVSPVINNAGEELKRDKKLPETEDTVRREYFPENPQFILPVGSCEKIKVEMGAYKTIQIPLGGSEKSSVVLEKDALDQPIILGFSARSAFSESEKMGKTELVEGKETFWEEEQIRTAITAFINSTLQKVRPERRGLPVESILAGSKSAKTEPENKSFAPIIQDVGNDLVFTIASIFNDGLNEGRFKEESPGNDFSGAVFMSQIRAVINKIKHKKGLNISKETADSGQRSEFVRLNFILEIINLMYLCGENDASGRKKKMVMAALAYLVIKKAEEIIPTDDPVLFFLKMEIRDILVNSRAMEVINFDRVLKMHLETESFYAYGLERLFYQFGKGNNGFFFQNSNFTFPKNGLIYQYKDLEKKPGIWHN